MGIGGLKSPALLLLWLIFGLQWNVPLASLWNNYIMPVLLSLWKPIKICETGLTLTSLFNFQCHINAFQRPSRPFAAQLWSFPSPPPQLLHWPQCHWSLLHEGRLSLVIADHCDPGLSLSPGRGVMAEPDYLEGDCDELIKPKKLINPVKNSRNHQDLHRELLMNQRRSGEPPLLRPFKRFDAKHKLYINNNKAAVVDVHYITQVLITFCIKYTKLLQTITVPLIHQNPAPYADSAQLSSFCS